MRRQALDEWGVIEANRNYLPYLENRKNYNETTPQEHLNLIGGVYYK